MQICVLGAGGFVGSRLATWLLGNSRNDVVGIDIDHRGVSHLLNKPRFSYYESDPRTDRNIAAVVSRADVVVNLMALPDGGEGGRDPSRLVERGLRSDLRVVRNCVEHDTRLIQWSPAESLEPRLRGADDLLRDLGVDLPASLRPGAIDDPRWLPVACRELTERVLYAYGDTGTLDFTIVRPSDMLGSSPNEASLEGSYRSLRRFDEILAALADGSSANGQSTNGTTRPVPARSRSYVHVEDVVELIGRIVLDDSGRASGQLYEVGNPANAASDDELKRLIGELYAERNTADHPPSETSNGDSNGSSGAQSLHHLTDAVAALGAGTAEPGLDITRATEDFDWTPRWSLSEAVIEAMEGNSNRLYAGRLSTPAQ